MRDWTVYMHIHRDSGRVYVGTTSQPLNNRFRKNGEGYRIGYGKNTKFYQAILDYGWDSFEHIVVADGLNESDAKHMEEELIAEYHSNDDAYGFNSTLGGDGVKGIVYTDDERNARRERMLGVVFSEETRKRMSEAKKDYVPWNKGKRVGFTDAQMKARSRKRVRTADGEFPSVTECAKYYGIGRKTLQDWLSGKATPSRRYAHICASYID